MSRARRQNLARFAASLVLVCSAASSSAATLFDPALRFRRMPTEHFIIYFHQGEERTAQRLAGIAEETWHAMERPIGVVPPRLTHVVLADQTELANGYATPLPYDTIVLYAVTPSGAEFDFNDWLRLTFTHEFTHIVHLDRSEGWARPVRWIFGRTAFAFPNLFLPTWQIEGLATYEESVLTGEGRLHAGDFRAVVDEAARDRVLEPLDRVNGGLTDWPSGTTVYAYGVGFHQYLADRFGPDHLATLADSTARTLPYFGSLAFKGVYGESLGSLWADYQASLTATLARAPQDPQLAQITHRGFAVSGPRFDPFACRDRASADCTPEIVYSEVNPSGFPSLNRVGLDGSAPRQLTERHLGVTAAIGPDEVYFDQTELRRNVGVYSDLYAWSRRSGRVRALSRDARFEDPDLSPDNRTLVCVQNVHGQRNLVSVRVKPDSTDQTDPITILVAGPDIQFNVPKWSPDGHTIVAERQRLGTMPEIVLIDVATRAVRVLASAPRTRFATPSWRPDGMAIVAAMAASDDTFNLVEINVRDSTLRSLTHTTGGATWPDVSPDGRTIVFVGYTTKGYDLFTMPYPASAGEVVRVINEQPEPSASVSVQRPTIDYSPLATLPPTSWSPVIEAATDQTRAGVAGGGSDVLGYHAYGATATWLVSAPSGALTPSAATPDWALAYVYSRWRPSFYLTASAATSFFAGVATDKGTPTDVTKRTTQVEGGVLLPFRHVRVQHAALLAISRAVDDYTLRAGSLTRERRPLRAAWQSNTSRSYGYSISREDGVTIGVAGEFVQHALGSFADATTVTLDTRAYLPGFASQHVVAIRLAGGSSTGDPAAGRTFLLGGDYPGAGVVDFDSRAISLMRGFPDDSFAGGHVALLNAEYRFPIARPQRGVGTWPAFLHTVHAALLLDEGQTWTHSFDVGAMKTSVGAELSANIVAGYTLPFTITTGAAWGHDASGVFADRVTWYLRVGKAF